MEHDQQVKNHHGRVEHERRESIHQGAGDGGIGRLPVGNVCRQPLAEKLHRKAQNLPQVGGAADRSHFALNAQRINC